MFTCVNIDNACLKGCYIKDNSIIVKERGQSIVAVATSFYYVHVNEKLTIKMCK